MSGLVAYKVEHTPLKDDAAARQFSSPDLHRLVGRVHDDITLDDLVGFHVVGHCPRCDHPSQDVFALKLAQGPVGNAAPAAAAGDDAKAAEEAITAKLDATTITGIVRGPRTGPAGPPPVFAVLRCNCVRNHSKSPSGFGCGASWLIGARFHLSAGQGQKVEFFKPSEAEEAEAWEEADRVSSAARTSLQTVQGSAKSWQAALASIVALVSITSVIAGRDAIQKLATPATYFVFSLAAATIALEAAALYLAALANLGFPSLKTISTLRSQWDLDLDPVRRAGEAARRLKAAAVLTFFAVAAALSALGVFVLAPSASPAEVNPVTVTFIAHSSYGNADSVCGELLASTPTKVVKGKDVGELTVKVDGQVHHYDRSQIAALKPGKC